MNAPVTRFEAAYVAIGGDLEGLRAAAAASLESRRSWRRWMRFDFAGRRWWMRVTNLRILIFVQRGDATAFTERWTD